jgi:hypothetical protein
MRFLRLIRRHPLALLGAIAVAFVVWLWRDALPTRQADLTEAETHVPRSPRRVLPPPAEHGVVSDLLPPSDAAPKLAKLKPGMSRAEVEQLVGPPAAHHVSPATVADGRVTYHTAYEADFGPPPTVRPIQTHARLPDRRPVPREPELAGRTLVTLEFDATKPGHPLVGIHYPDPLF